MMKRSSDDQTMNDNSWSKDMGSDSDVVKKARLDASTPSRVLHIRGVPGDASEPEIVQLGMPFGRMTNLVLARKKNQALLEMADIPTAQAMYDFYSDRPPQVRGRTVYVQYSNHQQLKTEPLSSINAGAQAALEAASTIHGGGSESHMGHMSGGGGGGNVLMVSHDGSEASGGHGSGQLTVLRIIIDNMMYPITVEILHKIFSKYGQVLKIVTFNKNNSFQALVQYSESLSAHSGKQALNGQNIYNGCCTLRIDFSKLTMLNVRYNNDKSWDYTNPNLPSGEFQQQPPQLMDSAGDGILGSFGGNSSGGNNGGNGYGGFSSMGNMGGGMSNGSGAGYNVPSLNRMVGNLSGIASLGHNMGGMMGGNMGGLGGALAGLGGGMGGMVGGMGMGMGMGGMGGGMGPMGGGGMGQSMERHGYGGQMSGEGNVLIVSNLNEGKITPDVIFTLFGAYGIITRIKILFNKKDTALIQYVDPVQAQNAIVQLDKCKWWGKPMKVSLSRHSHIQMPREDAQDAWMTKDFANSQQCRFKNAKNMNVNYPPSATLHLSNIPASITEDDIKDLFAEHGSVVAFKFFPKDRKMALIQMDSTDEAVDSLVALHNHELIGNYHLRVSFTKSVI